MDNSEYFVSNAVVLTMPMIKEIGGKLDISVTTALVGQNAFTTSINFPRIKLSGFEIFYDHEGKITLAIGDFALTPTYLVAAGILKLGADVRVNANIGPAKTLNAMMPPNLFTGKYNVTNIDEFLENKVTQVKTKIDVFVYCRNQLLYKGIITEDESASTVAGLINVAANTSVDYAIEARKNGII